MNQFFRNVQNWIYRKIQEFVLQTHKKLWQGQQMAQVEMQHDHSETE